MSTAKDLGLVTAYAYAVSKGYEGTEEEYAELMASYATVAEEAEGYAEQAGAAKDLAESARDQAAEWASGSVGGDPSETNNAKYYSEQAADQASEAARQAGLADASAIAAGQSEGAAASSASTASTKAGEAASSASAAAGSASTASTKAGEASTSATNANTAKTAAQAAQTAAETAQGKAEDAQEAAEAAAEQAEETLNSYAKVDGSYNSMTVGNAEQLVATVAVEDSVPYNFRTSGGTADIGDREVDKIVGGTIAWNQMLAIASSSQTSEAHGVTLTDNRDGSFTLNGEADGNANLRIESNSRQFISGHKYLELVDSACIITHSPSYSVKRGNKIVLPSQSGMSQISIFVYEGDVYNNLVIWPQIFDLTQMFGSTIADYIYSLETATPGAGVAWFRKLFPKPYYAYNPGELMSVQAAAHKMVGFNAWDEEWELGYINPNTGAEEATTEKIRMKNYMPILPNTTYYKKTPVAFWNVYFDANRVYIGKSYTAENETFTTPSNAHFYRCGFETAYGTTYHNDICINLSWDGERDGEYAPYESHTYPLDDSLTLRGIPKLDSGNGLYYDGDTYESDGTVTRRYGVVDLGTLEWANNGENKVVAYIADKATGSQNIFAESFTQVPSSKDTGGLVDGDIKAYDSTKGITLFRTGIGSANAATMLSGVMLVYELETPTTEEADPYQSPQIVDDFGTEEYVDAAVAAETRDVAIPVGHDTLYQANLRAKLEMSPDSPDGDGDYIVRQTNGQNAYVPLTKELPAAPTTEGTYHLKATVTSGGVTLTWEADT